MQKFTEYSIYTPRCVIIRIERDWTKRGERKKEIKDLPNKNAKLFAFKCLTPVQMQICVFGHSFVWFDEYMIFDNIHLNFFVIHYYPWAVVLCVHHIERIEVTRIKRNDKHTATDAYKT